MNVPALYLGTVKASGLPIPPAMDKRTCRKHHSLDDGLQTLSQFC